MNSAAALVTATKAGLAGAGRSAYYQTLVKPLGPAKPPEADDALVRSDAAAPPATPAAARPGASSPNPQPATPNPQPPTIPDHELLQRIGGGSYGEVWLARNALGAYRAVKIVRRENFEHDRPFEREFAGIQKFEPVSRQHEGLVDLLQVGRNDAEGWFYYVMELADAIEDEKGKGGRGAEEKGREGAGEKPAAISNSRFSIFNSQSPASATYTPKTLRSLLAPAPFPTSSPARPSRLPLDDCIALGIALARALAYLHGQGLVHRDIKPSNIIFVSGAPKLADVGLVASVGEARSYVGTEGFIPPEGPGSPQADLYGLGIVLYVMSTGQRHEDFPAPLPDLAAQPDHARWLEFNAVIHKACAANARERYRSAEEMQADLALLQQGHSVRKKNARQRSLALASRVAITAAAIALATAAVWVIASRFNGSPVQRVTAPPLLEANSLAVLPFFNESTNWSAHEYLCDALAEETINTLTNCAGLRVAPRSAAFAFKRATNDLRSIGEQLGVRTVLAGSFRRNTNGMRLNARLVNAADGAPLWSDSFERKREELGALGVDLVRPVAHQLNHPLDETALHRLATNLTRRLAAYRLYSQANSISFTNEDSINKCIALLSQAIVEDPGFAQAYAALAHAYTETPGWILPPDNAMAAAKLNAQRALELDESLATAHIALGTVFHYHEMDFGKAEAEMRRAIALDPGSPAGYARLALLMVYGLERYDEADRLLEQGERIDPKAQIIHSVWCWRYYYDRRFDEAVRAANRSLSILPHHQTVALMCLGRTQERLGRYDDALATARRLVAVSPDMDSVAFLGLVHARLGHRDEAMRSLEELRVMARSRGGLARNAPRVLLALGDRAAAVKQLRQAVTADPSYALRLKADPYYDDLRAEPEFQALFNGTPLSK